MESLLLSDPNYLKDLDEILKSIFNGKNLAKQPHFIVEIGCRDGFSLRHAFNLIRSETSRGKRLSDYPLEVIALILDEKYREAVHGYLSDIPHHIATISGTKSEIILRALSNLGIDDTRLSLYFEFFSTKEKIPFKEYVGLNSQFGLIELQCHALRSNIEKEYEKEIALHLPEFFTQQTAAEYLLDAASSGWFSEYDAYFQYPNSRPYTKATMNHFQHRPYSVRKATIADVPKLVQIQERCLAKSLRLPDSFIENQIKLYELGQLILEIDHVMVGFVLTQRIKNIDELDNSSEISVNKIQDVEGSVLHIIALYVLPEKHIVEEYFLEFIIHKVLVSSNITHIALVTRSQNYPGNDVIGMESYVEELQQEKGSADIATRLHFKQGAQIIKPIANYRPNDEKNLGYGILLLYDKESRKLNSHQNIARNISGGPVELNPDLIKTIVDENFKLFLRQKETGKKIEYNPMSTFEELGLESMQLLELRALLSGEFSVDLPLNFFILHETPNHIINHFIEIKLKPYKEWLYETKWVSRANPEVKVLEPNKTWIVFSDSNEQISSSIIEHLHGHKQKCITILSRNNFQKIDESTFSIRSISQDDYKQLFNEIQNFNEIAGVIYLCGLCDEVSELRDPPLSVLEGFHRYSLEGLILLVNNLATLKFPNPPRLWVVTKSIEQDGGVDSLSEWPLYALSKIIKEEYQKFQCTYIAINGQESPIEASERLFEEIRSTKNEPSVAFRKGERLVPRFVRSFIDTVRIPEFSPKASYLIAGGFRPLGVLLARWYVSHGAKNIILFDEIQISPEIGSVIEELEKEGANIIVAKIALDDEAAIANLFDKIKQELPPLQGVIHAAGLVDNDLIMHMNWDRFKTVHRLKVSLSWLLHLHTLSLDLDHFVLFSSCLPDIAPLGKSNHATGNSFLDVLSHYRRKRALPSLTINWGPWESRLMEVKRLVETSNSDRVRVLRIDEGLKALEHLFYIHKPEITAVVINWLVLLHSIADGNPLYNEISKEMGLKRVEVLKEFLEAKPEARLKIIKTYVHERIRRVLNLKASHLLEHEREFKNLGLDASKMTNLTHLIQFDLEEALKIPFNFVEANPTIAQLSSALKNALEAETQSKSLSKLKDPIAVIGLLENTAVIEIINKNVNIKLNVLSDEVIANLQNKLKNQGKSQTSIVTIDIIQK